MSPVFLVETNRVYGFRPRFFPIIPRFLAIKKPEDPQQREFGRDTERPMLARVEIVCSTTADTPGSCVLLHFDSTRYLFGQVAEGTQRMLAQRRVPMAKLDTIFLTGPSCWKNNGGLLGLVLTLAGMVNAQEEDLNAKSQKPKNDSKILHLFGPENLAHTLATARRFIFRQSLPLRPNEIRGDPTIGKGADRDPDYKDENIKVWYMPIWPDCLNPVTTTTSSSSTATAATTRKRSYEEMSSESTDAEAGEEYSREALAALDEDQRHQFLTEVVSHMFESKWHIDEVMPTTLYKAKRPAKLFVKDAEGKLVEYTGPMPGDEGDVPDIEVFVRKPWPGAKISHLPPTKPSKQALCYIVMTHSRRGKFDAVAAQKLGVPPTQRKFLTMGQTITLENGQIVTPDMVIGEPIPGRGFAVLDIPDRSYINAALGRPEMQSNTVAEQLVAVYWFVGPGVATDARVVSYIESRSKQRHYVSGPDAVANYLALESPAKLGVWMRMIDPRRFGSLHFNAHPKVTLPAQATPAMPGLGLRLLPSVRSEENNVSRNPDMDAVIRLMNKKAQAKGLSAAKIVATHEFAAQVEEAEKDIPGRDAEVITLGTGSAMPSKYRNVSATLLRVPGYGSYLFDCGENTLGQMERCFGEELPEVLRDLKLIWISHMHADHHLGTTSVLRAWTEETKHSAPDAKLAVASHPAMLSWLREYSMAEDFGFLSGLRSGRVAFHGFSREEAEQPGGVRPKSCRPLVSKRGGAAADLGLSRLEAVAVDHCYGSLAVCATFPHGLRVAYSGDCRPSTEFAEMARDATLLIHEATLTDELQAEARAKRHCTVSEAMGVAENMRARRVLLTHFSQRYPKIARIDSTESKAVKDQAVLFAFDHMRVKLGEWRAAQQFWPALKTAIPDED